MCEDDASKFSEMIQLHMKLYAQMLSGLMILLIIIGEYFKQISVVT